MSGAAQPPRITVVGGGIAGMVAALQCAKVGLTVTIVEQEPRFGGCLRAVSLGDCVVDGGAESFATRGGAVADLVRELGLGADIVEPNPAGAWLGWAPGMFAPTPRTGLLGIPANPFAPDVRAIIGWPGALRAYCDRLIPVLTIGRDGRLGPLVRRRMGRRVLERLVAPVARGVYSTDPDDLIIDRVAPGLSTALTRIGWLGGAVGSLVDTHRPGTAVLGLRGGMFRLAEALAARLADYDVTLRPGHRVTSIRSKNGGWEVLAAAGSTPPEPPDSPMSPEPPAPLVLTSEGLILATPSVPLPESRPPATTDPVHVVLLRVAATALNAAPRGTGVLVAPSLQDTVAAKALTHVSAKWEWLAATLPPGEHILRLSYDANRLPPWPDRSGPETETDAATSAWTEQVRARALQDAAALLGVPLTSSDVVAHTLCAWPGTRTAPTGTAPPGVIRVGAWVSGPGLAAVIPPAREAADRLRRELLAPKLVD